MKNIIKITCLALMICGVSGCTNNFEEYNTDPYKIYTADPSILLPPMMEAMMYVQQNSSQLVDQMVGTQGGYFTLGQRWGGQNFDTFNASDTWNAEPYENMFKTVYPNYFQVEKSTNKSGHYYAMARLIRAAVMIRVTDCYGPIPYSKVADGTFYVEYDTAEDVYRNIIADLAASATILSAYAQEYPSSQPLAGKDPIFNGDYSAWARLANSLCLRVAIRTNNQEAAESACAHPAGLIETNAQNALMSPGVQPNPYYLAAATWGEIRVNASIVDYMTGYEDPRSEGYFQKSGYDASKYIGMRSGEADYQKTDAARYSLPNMKSDTKLPIFVAAETNFLRAEAALKGWSVANSAQSYYETGIRLSMEQYSVSSDAVTTYLGDETHNPGSHLGDPRGSKYTYNRATQIKIKWNDGDSNAQKLERIITQKWIANYPMGIEAWAEFRRTGYPELAPVLDNLSSVISNKVRGMRRLRYPYTEKNLNRANYDKGVVLLGGKDDESVDLFWTKKN